MKQKVFEALNNSVGNGYSPNSDPLVEAVDLTTYCCDFEEYEPEDLVPYISEWLAQRELAMHKGWDLGI